MQPTRTPRTALRTTLYALALLTAGPALAQGYGYGPAQGYGYGPAQGQPPIYDQAAPPQWPGYHPPPMPQPEAVVRGGLEKLAAFLRRNHDAHPDVMRTFIAREIAPLFDLETMARWSTGPAFRRLNEKQRATVVHGIGKLFFSAMFDKINALDEGNTRFTTTGGRHSDDEAVVSIQIRGYDRLPKRLDFRLHQTEQGRWRVFDVAANGRSAVVYYRQHLNALLRERGLHGALQALAAY